MKLFFLVCSLIIIFSCIQMTFAQEDSKKGFALYLLPDEIKASELSKLDIKKIKPVGKPFLTTEDISSYLKGTHEIRLEYAAGIRLKKLNVPVSGKPFIVFANGEPVYTGAFWTGFSSISFKGVVIDVVNLKGDFPVIKLEIDYPSSNPENITSDPRPDGRIMSVLEKEGVLYEQVWLDSKCAKIRSTGKRHQSYVFTFAVISAVKSKFEFSEITFELYADFGGSTLLQALEAKPGSNSYMRDDWQFNSEKLFLLKFERQAKTYNPKIIFKDFEVR